MLENDPPEWLTLKYIPKPTSTPPDTPLPQDKLELLLKTYAAYRSLMHTLSAKQPEELSDESRLDWQAAYQIFTAVMEEVDRGTRGGAHLEAESEHGATIGEIPAMMRFVRVQNMIIQAYSKDFKITDGLTEIANKMKNFHQLVKENPFLPDESRKIASIMALIVAQYITTCYVTD